MTKTKVPNREPDIAIEDGQFRFWFDEMIQINFSRNQPQYAYNLKWENYNLVWQAIDEVNDGWHPFWDGATTKLKDAYVAWAAERYLLET